MNDNTCHDGNEPSQPTEVEWTGDFNSEEDWQRYLAFCRPKREAIVKEWEKRILESYSDVRSLKEVDEALEKLDHIHWYKASFENSLEEHGPACAVEILEAGKKVIEILGKEQLGPFTDIEWGMLLGKISALRWLHGEEWDV